MLPFVWRKPGLTEGLTNGGNEFGSRRETESSSPPGGTMEGDCAWLQQGNNDCPEEVTEVEILKDFPCWLKQEETWII